MSSWSTQGPSNSVLKSKTRCPNCGSPYFCPPRGKKHHSEESTRFLRENLIRSPSVWGNQKNFSFANKNRIFKAHPWTMHDLPYFPLLCQQPDTFLLQPQKCWKRNQNIFILLNHLHQSPSDLSIILQFVLQFCCLGWRWWATSKSNFLGKQTSTPVAKLHLGKALNICLREGKVTSTLQTLSLPNQKGTFNGF